jgi:hypothetical protein
MSKSAPGSRHEHVDRTAFGSRVELVDAFLCSEIDVKSLDGALARLTSQRGGRLFDFHLVGGNQQIKSMARANSQPIPVDAPVTVANCLSVSALRCLETRLSDRAGLRPFLTR